MAEALDLLAQNFGTTAAKLNYLIHYDQDHNVAYFETPKVACTSIKKYMQDKVYGTPRNLEEKGLVHDRSLSPIQPLQDYEPDIIKAVFFGDVRRFSFVRNPYSRILSGYLDKIVTNQWEKDRHLPTLGFAPNATPSLSEFLEALKRLPQDDHDIHFAKQSTLLQAKHVTYDFLGRFERFDEDFARLKDLFYNDTTNDNYATFGKHHASNAGDKVNTYFGTAERDLVLDMYGADFELLGYSTDIKKSSEPPVLPGHFRPLNRAGDCQDATCVVPV
jgi:Sulfotransferase family